MKKVSIVVLLLLFVAAAVVSGQGRRKSGVVMPDTVKTDTLEHRLIVLDPGFDAWLATQPSRDFYSQQYYETRNRLYVTEWNQRYSTGADGGIYNARIEYDFRINYGLDINYRLYNYFRYFEQSTGIRLLESSRR